MNTILLVYHCRRVRRQLTAVLTRRYAVVAAHGPAAAERLAGSRRPDLILVENSGHNGSAHGLLKWLRLDYAGTPVVALAHSDASHGAMMARRLGARAVVRWPGPVRQVFEGIARALGVGVRKGGALQGASVRGNGRSLAPPSALGSSAAENRREEVRGVVHQKR